MSSYSSLLLEFFYQGVRQKKLKLQNGHEEREYLQLKAQSSRKVFISSFGGAFGVVAFDQYFAKKLFSGVYTLPRFTLLVASVAGATYGANWYSFSQRQADLAAILADRYEEELVSLYADLKVLKTRRT